MHILTDSSEGSGQAQIPPAVANPPSKAAQQHGAATNTQKANSGSGAGNDNQKQNYGQMLNELIKESGNQEALKIKEEIDMIRKQRNDTIIQIKRRRRQLIYKEAESASIAKQIEAEKAKASTEKGHTSKIGYLKKMKNRLEFKIATEASSLSAEKELIRKIDEVNAQLREAYKGVRLERKKELIKSDMEQHKSILIDLDKQVVESDRKLDELYTKLRKLLGIEGGRDKKKPQQKQRQQPISQEISFEDIAVIKKKTKKEESEE